MLIFDSFMKRNDNYNGYPVNRMQANADHPLAVDLFSMDSSLEF